MEELRQTIQEHASGISWKETIIFRSWNCRKKTALLAAGGGSIRSI